ncbi:chitin deacetylase [Coprinellus micaceus]|uniref:Chitin deacetylase n=1 Tax=Coprinellus micaceus TaxID=71717 RepID=A0A4Y7RTP5_COPMI|nr:chitin deacetylase [Coprinellus micaceus]
MFGSILRTLTVGLVAASASVAAVQLPPHAPRGTSEHYRRTPGQVVTKCTVPNTVALTFDDGPWVYLYDVSKALIAAGGKGTFFFRGGADGCIYNEAQAKRVKYAYDKGHQVASHTWAHLNMSSLNWDQLHNEMWNVEEAIWKITGAYPSFVRPPYGEYNPTVVEAARARGQTIALWDFDSLDWSLDADSIKKRYKDLVDSRPSNVNALNHEVHQHSAQVVIPYAIDILKKAGYKLVTLAECLGQPAYQFTGTPAARDASWTCEGKATKV